MSMSCTAVAGDELPNSFSPPANFVELLDDNGEDLVVVWSTGNLSMTP